MTNTEKSHEEDDESDSSSLNRLPDDLILQILTKSPDLKTLISCHLVSKRFSSIVLQIDTITFIAPQINRSKTPSSDNNTSGEVTTTGFRKKLFWSLINGVVLKPLHLLKRMVVPGSAGSKPLPPMISSFYGDSFRSAVLFLSKFRGVKSLLIELPCSNHRGVDDSCLFKWKVQFGNRIESFVFLSPNSIHDTLGNRTEFVTECIDEEVMQLRVDLFKQKAHIAFQCLKDVIVRYWMLLYFVKDFPNLERLSIADSGKRGVLCLSAGKLDEVRRWICSVPHFMNPEMDRIEVPVNVSQCYVPVLNLPVSGFVMKGVTVIVMHMSDNVQEGNGCLMNGEDAFEDRVEAAYTEAMTEILENHRDKMRRLL